MALADISAGSAGLTKAARVEWGTFKMCLPRELHCRAYGLLTRMLQEWQDASSSPTSSSPFEHPAAAASTVAVAAPAPTPLAHVPMTTNSGYADEETQPELP